MAIVKGLSHFLSTTASFELFLRTVLLYGLCGQGFAEVELFVLFEVFLNC